MKFGSTRDLVEAGELGEVRVDVRDGDEVLACRVSREALEALAGRKASKPGDLVAIASDNFGVLTDKWVHRIELGVCEPDGSILLRRGDVASAKEPHRASSGRRPFVATE